LGGYAQSRNDGPVLPEGFACKELGMRIIRSLVARIGGELRIGRGDKDQGDNRRHLAQQIDHIRIIPRQLFHPSF
jgi:hypothetical protein